MLGTVPPCALSVVFGSGPVFAPPFPTEPLPIFPPATAVMPVPSPGALVSSPDALFHSMYGATGASCFAGKGMTFVLTGSGAEGSVSFAGGVEVKEVGRSVLSSSSYRPAEPVAEIPGPPDGGLMFVSGEG